MLQNILAIGLGMWVVCCALSKCKAEDTATQWVTNCQVGRFHIHCDFPLPADEPLKGDLANLAAEVTQILKLPPSDKPIHLVLFENSHEYSRYIRNYFPFAPERRALFIQHRGPGMLFAHWHADVHVDVRHEVVHGLLNAHSQPLPLWLDEGIAEYFEVAAPDRLCRNPHLSSLREQIRLQGTPELEVLEKLNAIEQLGNAQYRDSWAWAHFMIHRSPATRQMLADYLAEFRDNRPIEPLSRRLFVRFPNWRKDFQSHFEALGE